MVDSDRLKARRSGGDRTRFKSRSKSKTTSASKSEKPKEPETKYVAFSHKDPTLVFMASVLVSVVCVVGDKETKTQSLREAADIPSTLFNHVFDVAFLAGALYLSLSVYLANSAYFKGKHPQSASPHPSDVAAALVVTQTELCCHSLLCLFAYVGMCRKAPWRQEIGLIALTFQVFGAIVFVGSEFLTECLNMVPHNEPTCTPWFSPYEAFYYWFGVTVNFVWVVIPIVLAWDAISSSVAEKES